MRMEQSLQQRQVLSLQMQQRMDILRYNNQELAAYLKQLSLDNPLIKLQHFHAWHTSSGVPDTEQLYAQAALRTKTTLQDYLREQIGYMRLSKERAMAAYTVIDQLDSNGRLMDKKLYIKEGRVYPDNLLSEALKLVRSLDPPGVGATDLSDCLCLQLERLQLRTNPAYAIAKRYLPMLAQSQSALICKALQLSDAQYKDATQAPFPAGFKLVKPAPSDRSRERRMQLARDV